MVKLGGKAPEFCLKDQHGRKHCLKDYLKKKKIVVIYFYPKDDTPGCSSAPCYLLTTGKTCRFWE